MTPRWLRIRLSTAWCAYPPSLRRASTTSPGAVFLYDVAAAFDRFERVRPYVRALDTAQVAEHSLPDDRMAIVDAAEDLRLVPVRDVPERYLLVLKATERLQQTALRLAAALSSAQAPSTREWRQ